MLSRLHRHLSLAVITVLAATSLAAAADNPIVPDAAKLETLYTRPTNIIGGLTEGPTVAPDGSIYFTDIRRGEDKGKIHRFDPKTGKTTVFAEDSYKANGLFIDPHGDLYACEGADVGGRAIVRYDLKTGKRTVLADSIGGKRLNSPNDLVLDADGRVYFTDPRYIAQDNEPRELEHRAVYRIDTDGTIVEVTHDIEKPNGIALSRDQKTLYVADHNNGTDAIGSSDEKPKHGAMKIYAYPLGANGLVNGPKKVLHDFGTEAGCDGMCIDSNGNLYLTARSPNRPGVLVLDPKGKEIAFIATGPANQGDTETPVGLPSNVTFGIGSESNTLYVTVGTSLQRIKLKSQGYQLPFFDDETDYGWTRIEIDPEFRSEGVAVADFNGDGRNDVLAGDLWYEAPRKLGTTGWKQHPIREVGSFVAGVGYSNSFCNYAWDVDKDGLQDAIVVGFPGAPFHWYRNPGSQGGKWVEQQIWSSICNESPDFADITGDGTPEFVLGSQPEAQMGYSALPGSDAKPKNFTAISEKGDPHKNGTFKYYHGLGYGDLNKDGRTDVLIAHGWWEQPEKLDGSLWKFHAYALARDGVNPERMADIYVEDLDLDGDNDLIASSAHAHGVWWFENTGSNDAPTFKYHLIDESHSQTHAMEYVDINGDGQRDIVTGKRFFAHNGNDPGGRDPVRMFWYEVRRMKGQPPQFIRHEIAAGRDTGIGTQFQTIDFNGDGKLDIALSNKKGVNLLIQK